MYFYELHEGDDDLMAAVIVACETPMPRAEFFALVREIHERIRLTYEEDTLVEAIAAELEREHEFVHVSDDRIVAAVLVASDPGGDVLIATGDAEVDRVDEDAAQNEPGLDDETRDDEDDDEDEDEDDVDLDELPDYLTVVADFEPPTRLS